MSVYLNDTCKEVKPPIWFSRDMKDFDLMPIGSRDMERKIVSKAPVTMAGSAQYIYGRDIGILVNKETDYDFSTMYSPETEQRLQDIGFTLVGKDYGQDSRNTKDYYSLVAVYEKKRVGETVQILLHQNESLFRNVWGRISPTFWANMIWKSNPEKLKNSPNPEETKKQIRKAATLILNEMMLQEYIAVTGENPYA